MISRRYPRSVLNYLKCVSTLYLHQPVTDRDGLSQFPVSPHETSTSYSLLTCRSLMVAGLGSIPPACAVNFVPWAIVGFTFQFILRRWHFSFWAKYNCMCLCHFLFSRRLNIHSRSDVLSAALDGGTAIGVMLVYFW